MRAFVAIELPVQVMDAIERFQRELESVGADLKLVERENLHFTVKYLGEISESQASEAGRRLAALSLRGAEVEVKGVGAFPSPGRPRVVWAGVPGEQEALVAPIAEAVIAALDGIGESDDRPFRAHVTLGRVRTPRNFRELGDFITVNSGRAFGKARLNELKLKSSLLTPRGPMYSDIGGYQLA